MNLNVVWSAPKLQVQLCKDEVHVWRALLDIDPAVQAVLAASLDTDEKRRAKQFVFARDRNHFAAAHGIVRKILGGYLQKSPEELRFLVGRHGKPALANDKGSLDLRFNLSHSSGLALLAVAVEKEVGIDVEKIQGGVATDNLETTVFTAGEQAEFQNTALGEREREFLQRWTCKEAYVKARGEGLQIPFNSFEVALAGGKRPELRHLESHLWKLVSFSPAEDFVAALVVEGKNTRLRFWDWC